MQGGECYGQGLTCSGPWPGGHGDAAAAEGGAKRSLRASTSPLLGKSPGGPGGSQGHSHRCDGDRVGTPLAPFMKCYFLRLWQKGHEKCRNCQPADAERPHTRHYSWECGV